MTSSKYIEYWQKEFTIVNLFLLFIFCVVDVNYATGFTKDLTSPLLYFSFEANAEPDFKTKFIVDGNDIWVMNPQQGKLINFSKKKFPKEKNYDFLKSTDCFFIHGIRTLFFISDGKIFKKKISRRRRRRIRSRVKFYSLKKLKEDMILFSDKFYKNNYILYTRKSKFVDKIKVFPNSFFLKDGLYSIPEINNTKICIKLFDKNGIYLENLFTYNKKVRFQNVRIIGKDENYNFYLLFSSGNKFEINLVNQKGKIRSITSFKIDPNKLVSYFFSDDFSFYYLVIDNLFTTSNPDKNSKDTTCYKIYRISIGDTKDMDTCIKDTSIKENK